jgi:hypothetical protein
MSASLPTKRKISIDNHPVIALKHIATFNFTAQWVGNTGVLC